ncbi:MAG: ChbG/HpnK family deacetylase [Syntrophobacteraceae bacterium]|nr:ChbG/HpnK family deacetylase [Syntrophobacteraceae bacterium]
MASRILIINADDAGYSRGINDAIAQCSAGGALTSTTLMAGGRAFEHAVKVLGRAENLGIGVHLVLTDLEPLTPDQGLEGLMDQNGCLPRSPEALLRALAGRRAGRQALRRELSLQVEKVLDHGIVPTHLDSHKHVHLLPPILEVVLEVAARYGIRWIRSPFDATGGPWSLLRALQGTHRQRFLSRWVQARATRILEPRFRRAVHKAGLRIADGFYGTALTGMWSMDLVRAVFEKLPPGRYEWMVHPGADPVELRRMGTRLVEERQREMELLLSSELKRFLHSYGILPGSYGSEA